MKSKLKSAASWLNEGVETACGWALLAVALYAALFVDFTGNGALWNSLRGLTGHVLAPEEPGSVRVVKVPTVAKENPDQGDRFLVIEEEPVGQTVAAAVPAPDAFVRPASALTDSPADPQAAPAKTWHKKLDGELRSFTVYGQGDQTTSASATVGTYAAPAAARVEAAPASAAARGGSSNSGARPGVGSRLRGPSGAASDSVRNLR